MNYRVLAPLGFTNGRGEGMSCTTVGAVVEVDESEAEALVAAGQLELVRDVEGKTGTHLDGVKVSVDGVDQGEPKTGRTAKPRSES